MKMAQITPTVKLQPKRALLLRVSPQCCFYPAGPTASASLCASPQGSCPFPPFFPAQSRAVQQPRAPQRSVGPCRSPGSSRLCPGCRFGVRADEPGAGGSKTRRPPPAPAPSQPTHHPAADLQSRSPSPAGLLPCLPPSLPCLLPSAAARGPPPRTPPARPGGGGRARALCEGLSPGPGLPQPRCPPHRGLAGTNDHSLVPHARPRLAGGLLRCPWGASICAGLWLFLGDAKCLYKRVPVRAWQLRWLWRPHSSSRRCPMLGAAGCARLAFVELSLSPWA